MKRMIFAATLLALTVPVYADGWDDTLNTNSLYNGGDRSGASMGSSQDFSRRPRTGSNSTDYDTQNSTSSTDVYGNRNYGNGVSCHTDAFGYTYCQ